MKPEKIILENQKMLLASQSSILRLLAVNEDEKELREGLMELAETLSTAIDNTNLYLK